MTMPIDPLVATATDLQVLLTEGSLSSETLVQLYLSQIARHNSYFRAVIATAPDELLYKRARELDQERANGTFRGPLHGIPILIKDNIGTVPALGLPTTCGSLALVGAKPKMNAGIVDKLQAAGVILLGKANLSEWAWSKSDLADSGWSAVGGQTQPAYVRGGFREDDSNGGHSNPGGSSSGSAVSVAIGFAPVAIGTETMGSLMMPSDRAALYALKPTVKIVPQNGIVPVSYEADAAGPMTKSVQDLADLLDVLVDPQQTSIPDGGYRSAVTGSWAGIRVGVLEPDGFLFPPEIEKYEKEATDQMLKEWKAAYETLRDHADAVKTVTLLTPNEATKDGKRDIWDAFQSTFKTNIEAFLATLEDSKITTLESLVEFNKKHAEQELGASANYNQNGFTRALSCNMSDDRYRELLTSARKAAGPDGIAKTLEDNDVDVIIGPGDGLLFTIAATAGYPVATLPLGYLDFNGRPFGLQMTAKSHQEGLLIRVQSAWESTFPKRRPPPIDQIDPEGK